MKKVIQKTKQLSDQVKAVLTAATHSSDINDIANELGVKLQVVVGSLAKIKKDELATYENHKLVLTKAGIAAINATTKKVKNKDVVAALVKANQNLPHADLVKLIATTLGKTVVDARVYLYNYEKDAGLRTVGQKQQAQQAEQNQQELCA
jgi:predicted transcriptional regulator